jgi:hypothetical protein
MLRDSMISNKSRVVPPVYPPRIQYVYPALLITKATGTLDDTSTSSEGGGGETREGDSVTGTQPGCTGRNIVCAGGVETSCAVEVQATSMDTQRGGGRKGPVCVSWRSHQ